MAYKNSLKISLWLCLLASLAAGCQPTTQQVHVEEQKTASGHQYTVFYPQKLAIRFVTNRPSVANSTYQLSVAAAYTNLDNDQPLDLLAYEGQLRQTKPTITYLGGVLTSVGDTLTIGRLLKGPVPLAAQLARVRRQHGTLLLQELLVYEGKSQYFSPGNTFQRRALVEFANRHFAVVESADDGLTMSQFSEDLRELGAKNALYLDMGDWDEGWYKAGGQVVKLGLRRTQTARQSNWLVFAKPAPAAAGPGGAP